jgi:hypothetical protein
MFSYSAIFLQTEESELQENYFNGACNTLGCRNECSYGCDSHCGECWEQMTTTNLKLARSREPHAHFPEQV